MRLVVRVNPREGEGRPIGRRALLAMIAALSGAIVGACGVVIWAALTIGGPLGAALLAVLLVITTVIAGPVLLLLIEAARAELQRRA